MSKPTQDLTNQKLALEWLSDLAARNPELRLMQIVFNALDAKGLARSSDGTPRDIFYVSDEQLKEALRDAVNTPNV